MEISQTYLACVKRAQRLFLTLFLFISFRKKGFNVRSFGTGNQVKLPGPSPTSPNIYDFSTTYDEMYKDLLRKDSDLYPFSFKILCFCGGKVLFYIQYTQD